MVHYLLSAIYQQPRIYMHSTLIRYCDVICGDILHPKVLRRNGGECVAVNTTQYWKNKWPYWFTRHERQEYLWTPSKQIFRYHWLNFSPAAVKDLLKSLQERRISNQTGNTFSKHTMFLFSIFKNFHFQSNFTLKRFQSMSVTNTYHKFSCVKNAIKILLIFLCEQLLRKIFTCHIIP